MSRREIALLCFWYTCKTGRTGTKTSPRFGPFECV